MSLVIDKQPIHQRADLLVVGPRGEFRDQRDPFIRAQHTRPRCFDQSRDSPLWWGRLTYLNLCFRSGVMSPVSHEGQISTKKHGLHLRGGPERGRLGCSKGVHGVGVEPTRKVTLHRILSPARLPVFATRAQRLPPAGRKISQGRAGLSGPAGRCLGPGRESRRIKPRARSWRPKSRRCWP